jgi:hypothetical protein
MSAFKLHSGLKIEGPQIEPTLSCRWLLVESLQNNNEAIQDQMKKGWVLVQTLHRSYLDNEDMDVFMRETPKAKSP